MKGILVRTGVDHSYGGWNAPVDPSSGRFVYVPIPEGDHVKYHEGCERRFAEITPALHNFADRVGCDLFGDLRCPPALLDGSMHLDPDYEHLTYGDVGDRRGSEIKALGEDDFLVFYAGLRPCTPAEDRLIYAIVGIFVVDEVVDAADVPRRRIHENAHTRKLKLGASDIVVRGKPTVSGRLRHCIPIGEYRDRAYRVRRDLLEAWGGLSVNDGYIQRSARPPRFLDPGRFMTWFERQNEELIRANNPDADQESVAMVHLRRPNAHDPGEMRSDPFWEFGSFGCTGCHMKNLMNPDRIHELDGVRLAFAQGGRLGFRLVMLTPPVRAVWRPKRCELKWDASSKPFRYETAPLLINNDGESDFALLKRLIRADRSTWCGRFSSRFRSRRSPLREDVARELICLYRARVAAASSDDFASGYAETMPYPPNVIDRDREGSYKRLVSPGSINKRRRSKC